MAARLLPNDAGVHNNLGNALGRLGELDEAVASFRRALLLNPDFAEAHSNLGCALLELGRFDDAAASYRRALEIESGFADAHHNLGNALRGLGKLASGTRVQTEFRRGALQPRHRSKAAGPYRRSASQLPQSAGN